MNTKTCKSCKSEIHEDAKICPHCQKSQQMGMLTKFFLLLILLTILNAIFGRVNGPSPKTTVAPKTAEQIAAEKRKSELRSKVSAVLSFVKQNTKNPDSFKEDKVGITADETVCITYHATNSFNAVVPGFAYERKGNIYRDQEGFVKHCSKPKLDYLDLF